MSFNKVLLLGNLGADPELRYTPNQTAVCSFRIATTERRKNAEGEWVDQTEWHNITTFGKTAENCNTYLQKGRQVFVDGRIQTRKYQDSEGKDKYFTEIIANQVTFVGGGKGAGATSGIEVERTASPKSAGAAATAAAAGAAGFSETISFDDDDIPF